MKNLVIAAGIIIAIAVVGYVASKNSTEPNSSGDDEFNLPSSNEMPNSGSTQSGSNKDMDLSGIHIMSDGSVMLGDGTTLTDASVNADGMIVLGDGTEVEPMMDMR